MNRLKELRKKHNMSQTDVADALGLSQTAVYSYEKERNKLTADIIAKLCVLFSCSADYLLGLSEDNSRLPDDSRLPELTRELLRDIPGLSEDQQRHIKDFIRLVRGVQNGHN